MLSADDVIDLMRRKRIILVEQAVLAAPGRPFGDEQTHGSGDLAGHGCRLRLKPNLCSCLRHDHQMLETKILLKFVVLGGRDLAFAPALN